MLSGKHEIAALIACAEALRAHGDVASAERASERAAQYRDAIAGDRSAA